MFFSISVQVQERRLSVGGEQGDYDACNVRNLIKKMDSGDSVFVLTIHGLSSLSMVLWPSVVLTHRCRSRSETQETRTPPSPPSPSPSSPLFPPPSLSSSTPSSMLLRLIFNFFIIISFDKMPCQSDQTGKATLATRLDFVVLIWKIEKLKRLKL